MPILLFLIDTSASMNQRSHLGTTYLDTAKGAVETFMKVLTDRARAAIPSRRPAGGWGGREGGRGRRGGGVGDLTAGAAGLGDPLPHRAGGRAVAASGARPGPGLRPREVCWGRSVCGGRREGVAAACAVLGMGGRWGRWAPLLRLVTSPLCFPFARPVSSPVPHPLSRSSVPGILPAEETGICWSLSKSRPMLSR